MTRRGAAALLLALWVASCAAPAGSGPEVQPGPAVLNWGTMRTVLREARTEGRIALADVLGPRTIAVGAAAHLAAEITVVDGVAYLAEADGVEAEGVRVRRALPGEEAALLVSAEVEAWSVQELPPTRTLAELEDAVRAAAVADGLDPTRPLPFRVKGASPELRLHVLRGSCPIAHPDGPPPWRFAGAVDEVELVGFFAEGAVGVLTHHGQRSHVHAVLADGAIAGHVDAVELTAGARLFLPRVAAGD